MTRPTNCEHPARNVGACVACGAAEAFDLDSLEAISMLATGELVEVDAAELLALVDDYRRIAAAPRSPSVRHHYRQRQIEKLRHSLARIAAWTEPVSLLAVEAEVMHKEVERLRAVLAHIAAGGLKPADVARQALAGAVDEERAA